MGRQNKRAFRAEGKGGGKAGVFFDNKNNENEETPVIARA